jgi:hypothetical protein
MTQAIGFQLHCCFLSLLLAQATSEFLMNKYGSPNTGLAQFITLTCSCQNRCAFPELVILPSLALPEYELSGCHADVFTGVPLATRSFCRLFLPDAVSLSCSGCARLPRS